ncbi:MAG: hypothetical protein GOVbin4933_27 [Prokaryotic dsDNA virus sp.]|nr:MAG: hypothetical protein GOVbin4933_27 [Prokaryotic dsDNA virus sp.]|tara:strand:+ start:7718 stop:8194 length:477 start_codon:yes stop_codon:yes gene_type:complete
MSNTPFVWLYGGATCEDVYDANDTPREYLDLDMMASPQCWRVANELSEAMINEIAAGMFEQLAEYYWDGEDPSLFPPSLNSLQKVVSSKVRESTGPKSCEEGQTEPLEVVEVTKVAYFEETDTEQKHPLMLIVIQKRPVWQRVSLAEVVNRDDTDRAS